MSIADLREKVWRNTSELNKFTEDEGKYLVLMRIFDGRREREYCYIATTVTVTNINTFNDRLRHINTIFSADSYGISANMIPVVVIKNPSVSFGRQFIGAIEPLYKYNTGLKLLNSDPKSNRLRINSTVYKTFIAMYTSQSKNSVENIWIDDNYMICDTVDTWFGELLPHDPQISIRNIQEDRGDIADGWNGTERKSGNLEGFVVNDGDPYDSDASYNDNCDSVDESSDDSEDASSDESEEDDEYAHKKRGVSDDAESVSTKFTKKLRH
jgi:hypothetical protein